MLVVDVWFLFYFIWMSLICSVDGGSVEMSYTSSRGAPDFYTGESLTITCTASGYSGELSLLGLVSRSEGDEFDQPLAGCSYGVGNRWSADNELTGLGLTGPTVSSQCISIGNKSGFSVSAAGPISKDKLTSNVVLQCAVYNGSWSYSTNSIKDITIKEGPSNLKLIINPGQPVEGKQFSMSCNATPAVPASRYRYLVTRMDNKEVFNSNTLDTYIPTNADRGGLAVKCIDESHPHWVIQDVQASLTRDLHYLECTNDGKVINKPVNPKSQEHLTCYCVGNPKPIIYTWTKNGDIVHGEASATFQLKNSKKNTVDTITCKASLPTKDVNANITWNVNWTAGAAVVINPVSTPPPTPEPDIAAMVGGIVGGVVGAIIITAVVIYCCKKRSGSNGNNKPNELRERGGSGQRPTQTSSSKSKSNGEKEPKKKAPGPPTIAMPSEDDKIIYAELDHSTPIQRVTAPGSEEQYALVNKPRYQNPPPPAEPVEYAAIDFIKTGNPHSNNVIQPQNPPNPQPEALYSNTPATGQPANQQHGARTPVGSTRVAPGSEEQYSLVNKPRYQTEPVEYAAIDFIKAGNPNSNVTQPQNPPNPQPDALYSNTPDTRQPANQQHGARTPVASTRMALGRQTPPSMRYENY